jgi:hypothetical protein
LISCADDSVRWLRAQLGATSELPLASIEAAQRLAIPMPAGASPFPELEFAGYGLGWISGTYRDRRLVWHNGGIDGFTTQTLLLPRERLGVLVSANQHLTNFSLAALLAITDSLLGVRSEISWFDRPRAADDEAPDESVPPASPPTTTPSHALEAYAGTYHDEGYGDVRVTLAGDGLDIHLCGSDVASKHRHFDTWTLTYQPLDQSFPVTFHADAGSQITHAEVEFEPAQPIRFVRKPEASA